MAEDGMITRRRLLVAGGLGAFGITAGVVSIYDPTTLRYIGVDNRTDTQQTVEVRVDANDDRVLEQEIGVEGKEWTQVPCEWPVPARMYQVGARLDDENEWAESPVRSDGNAYRIIRIIADRVEVRSISGVPGSDSGEREQVCEIPWWVDTLRSGSA